MRRFRREESFFLAQRRGVMLECDPGQVLKASGVVGRDEARGYLLSDQSFRGVSVPKMKTIKGAAKRFHITGTGKLKRHHALCNHILTKKSPDRKRGLRQATYVATQGDVKRLRRMLLT